MAEANNTLEETIAIGTAATEITRDAASVGTALKTISMRIRGYDEETEEYIGNTEILAGDIADLTKTAKNPEGVSLFRDKDKTEFKSTAELLRDISKIYDELTDKQQAALLEKLAGKRQGQIIAAILNNFDTVESSLESMANADGSAMAEMGIVTESLTYKLNALKETGVGIAQNLFQREDMGRVIDGLTSVLEIVDKLTSELGLFGTGAVGLGIFSLFKKDSWLGNLRAISKVFKDEGMAGAFGEVAAQIGVSSGALSAFIGIAGGLVAIVGIVDALTTSFGEMTKKASDLRKQYNETQTNIESLNKELSETKARIKELNGKDKLSLEEEQELNNLQRQNTLLENQIKLQEKLADIQGRAAASAAKDVFSKKDSFTQRTALESYTQKRNKLNSLNAQEMSLSTKMQRYTADDMADVSPFMRNARQKAYQEDKKALENLQSEQSELMQELSEYDATFAENYASLFDQNGKLYDENSLDTVRQYNEAVLYSGTVSEIASQKQSALNDIISAYVSEEDRAKFSMESFKESIGEDGLSDLQLQLAQSGLSLSDFQYALSNVGNEIANGDLRQGAEEAKAALESLSKYKDVVGIGSALTTTAEGEDLRTVLERNINQMNDLKARPDVDVSDIENANKIIAYCTAEMQKLDEPAVLTADTSGLNKGQRQLVNLLNEFNEVSNQRDIEIAVGADTSESDEKLASLQSQISSQTAELELDVDTSSIESVKSALQNNNFAVSMGIDVDPLPKQDASGTVYYENDVPKLPEQKASGTIKWKNQTETPDVPNIYRTITYTYQTKGTKPTGGGGGFNGTAHFRGTAFARGDWGASHGGRALVGELGTEIRVFEMPLFMVTYKDNLSNCWKILRVIQTTT